MPIVNRMAELHEEITQWRRYIHANPELMYDVHNRLGLANITNLLLIQLASS